ncbi:mRNA turnover protein 4 homolog [Camellia sinensis]|uniref:mRNA turnover protein 4 homolog n=1 Tax=Camellia sinensis TaxID=4442 RepID=UPI001036CDBB|nr:mRNA turnover protein 4 homolog [Camellia sinensis]
MYVSYIPTPKNCTYIILIFQVELQEGPLDQFTYEMKPFLHKQRMPVRLNKGLVELVLDFIVCEEGKPLSPESARILGVSICLSCTHSRRL